ncbi:MAG: hypothetical protein MR314_01800 [Ezakiella sp.]|nr:hypothetical protein [Ezakiella sp.]
MSLMKNLNILDINFIDSILPILLLLFAISFFVIGLFYKGKAFHALSLICMLFYFYINITYNNLEMIWVLTMIVGVIMLILELMVPGASIFGALGLVMISISTINSIANVGIAILVMLLAVAITVLIVNIFIKKGYRPYLFDKLILSHNNHENSEEKYIDLVGKKGTTTSILRPIGTGYIDGNKYDLYSEDGFIPEGADIEVIRIDNLKIVVRRI